MPRICPPFFWCPAAPWTDCIPILLTEVEQEQRPSRNRDISGSWSLRWRGRARIHRICPILPFFACRKSSLETGKTSKRLLFPESGFFRRYSRFVFRCYSAELLPAATCFVDFLKLYTFLPILDVLFVFQT